MAESPRGRRLLASLAAAMVVLVGGYGLGVPAYGAQALRDAFQPGPWGGPDTSDSLERYILDVPAIAAPYGRAAAAPSADRDARPRASRRHRPAVSPAQSCAGAEIATAGTGGWRNLPKLDVSAALHEGGRGEPAGCRTERVQPAVEASATGTSRAQALKALQEAPGVRHVQVLRAGGVFVAVEPGTDPKKLPGVRAVEDASVLPLLASVPAPNDPQFSSAWGLQNNGYAPNQPAIAGVDTGALDAWGATMGAGAVVAVLDNGVNVNHVDLARNIWRNADEVCGGTDTDRNGYPGDCQGWNYYSNNADVTNSGGGWHGTGVAGTVAALAGNNSGAAGLAPQATILPVVVGSGQSVYTALAIEGIYYAADNGAHVINASFGGPLYQHEIDAYNLALAYAEARGVTFVSAAGNDGGNRDTHPLYPASLKSPGKLTVGSHNADDTMSYFSGYGQGTVDLFAPGFHVLVPDVNGSYSLASGTSVSAPYVAAAAALVRSQDPTLTPAQRADLIRATVVAGAAYSGRSVSGGRLSAGRVTGELPRPISYAFAGLDAVSGAPLRTSLTIAGDAPVGAKSLQLTLASRYAGRVWVVPDVAVTVNGQEYRTDGAGRVVAPLGAETAAGWIAPVEVTLPAGEFAFVTQLLNDGQPVEAPKAAPFVVRPEAATSGSDSPAPGGDGATAPAPGGGGSTAPAPSPGTAPGTGGGSPAPDQGTGIAPPPSGVDSGTGPVSGPDTGLSPGAGGSVSPPGAGDSGVAPAPEPAPQPGLQPAPGTGGGSAPSPVDVAPGGTDVDPGSGAPAPGSGTQPQPSAPPSSGRSGTPDLGGTKTYPGTDSFGVTSFEPYRVSTSGGDSVTVVGHNLPLNASVTVGSTSARVISSSSTRLIFAAPALAAGTRDVLIYSGNRSELFAAALLYVNPETGSGSGDVTPAPGGDTSGGQTGGGDTSGGGSGTGGGTGSNVPAPPQELTGPGGLQLVAAPDLDGLLGLWESVDCRPGCRAASF